MWADLAIEKVCEDYTLSSILDIGSGNGYHAQYFKIHTNAKITTVDYNDIADIQGNYMDLNMEFIERKPFDCIWASHVLEHQLNVNAFLKKVHFDLVEGGVFAVTVPPAKHEIVGGHVTLWNAGLLLYNLILAGFNCSKARIKQYGYNISVIVEKKSIVLPKINYDHGDIDLLAEFFPEPYRHESFNGNIQEWNWRMNDG